MADTVFLRMDDEKTFPVLNSFYYLAPLWFVVETFLWPNFRAGAVLGGGQWGTAAFYAVEAGIGAALWFRLPYAAAGALLENVIYLVFAMKFILYAPIDAATALAADTAVTEEFAKNYITSLPGIMYSMLYMVAGIKQQIRGIAGRPAAQ